jgi:hypothetical protein
MVSGKVFRHDKLLDRRAYLRLVEITKTIQAVHAIVRQTHAPSSTPSPQKKLNRFAQISWVDQGPDGEVRTPDPRFLWPAPRLIQPRLF